MEEIFKIKSLQFTTAAVKKSHYPTGNLPEIAFAGRSNVGKSSLINTLVNRKSFAKTSSTPGKTKQIVFFTINQEFYFVDLPGYGYAKVSKGEQKGWVKRIDEYFIDNGNLKLLLLLLDVRREISEFDIQMFDYITNLNINFLPVLTKVDKLSNNEIKNAERNFRKKLDLDDSYPLILFSSKTKKGKDEVWREILSAVKNVKAETKDISE